MVGGNDTIISNNDQIIRFRAYCKENNVKFPSDKALREEKISQIFDIINKEKQNESVSNSTDSEYIYEFDVKKPIIENENKELEVNNNEEIVIENKPVEEVNNVNVINEIPSIESAPLESVVTNVSEIPSIENEPVNIITPVPPVEPNIPVDYKAPEVVEVTPVVTTPVTPVPPVEPNIPVRTQEITEIDMSDRLTADEANSLKSVANINNNINDELRNKYSSIVREDLMEKLVSYNGESIPLVSYLDKMDILNKIGTQDSIYRLESGSDVTTDLNTYINEALIPTILNSDLDSIKNLDELINESGFIIEHRDTKDEKKGLFGFFKKGK